MGVEGGVRVPLRKATMDYGWMSPKFDSMGCLGAIFFFIMIVGAAFGLLYMVWTVVRAGAS